MKSAYSRTRVWSLAPRRSTHPRQHPCSRFLDRQPPRLWHPVLFDVYRGDLFGSVARKKRCSLLLAPCVLNLFFTTHVAGGRLPLAENCGPGTFCLGRSESLENW